MSTKADPWERRKKWLLQKRLPHAEPPFISVVRVTHAYRPALKTFEWAHRVHCGQKMSNILTLRQQSGQSAFGACLFLGWTWLTPQPCASSPEEYSAAPPSLQVSWAIASVFEALLSVPEFRIVAADVLRLRRKSKIGWSGFSVAVVVVVVSIQAFSLGHVQGG